jgi:hypothetical protein
MVLEKYLRALYTDA